MRKAVTAVVCLVLLGCEYTVPLVKTPALDIDRSVVGLWERSTRKGRVERLLILPLNQHEYLVSFPAGSEKAMFARGCLWQEDDITLVQLDWFGTAQAKLPPSDRTFQFATYAVEGDQISIRFLNSKIVPKDIASSEELARSIKANRANPSLFREAMTFEKVRN